MHAVIEMSIFQWNVGVASKNHRLGTACVAGWTWFRPGSRRTLTTMAGAIANIIDDLEDRGHLKGTDIANIANVSAATVSRWRTGKATPQPRTQLVIADLRYVVDRLADIYTADETRIWLYSRNALLDGERAIDLINQNRTEEILAAIERLQAGAFL